MTSTTTINSASRQQKSRSLKKVIHIIWLCLDHPWLTPCYLYSSKLHVFIFLTCRWAFSLICFFSAHILKSFSYKGEPEVELWGTCFLKGLLRRGEMRKQITNCNSLGWGNRKDTTFSLCNLIESPKSWGESKEPEHSNIYSTPKQFTQTQP